MAGNIHFMTRDWDVVAGEAMMALTVDCTCTNVVDWFSSTFLLTIYNAWADTLDRYHFRNFKRPHFMPSAIMLDIVSVLITMSLHVLLSYSTLLHDHFVASWTTVP
jgi:hypothetical protein